LGDLLVGIDEEDEMSDLNETRTKTHSNVISIIMTIVETTETTVNEKINMVRMVKIKS
jgi:hypothetical protein